MSYLKFIEGPPKPKTRVWDVTPSDPPCDPLGVIKWYGPWRRYCFFPNMSLCIVILEEHCLRDIADFCEQATNEHKGDKCNG